MSMIFSGLELSRRLERAEGRACVEYAKARRRIFPTCGAEWIECAGAYAVFDGVDSPVTQTFGLGMFEQPTDEALAGIESFFLDRGAPVCHEMSPFAGVGSLALLCRRKYEPAEISNVLYRALEDLPSAPSRNNAGQIRVRVIKPHEATLWSEINARGWAHDHPEYREMLLELGTVSAAREDTVCFIAELDGHPAAAGILCIHDGVALFAGAATVPEFRRRGLQSALLRERLRHARERGCDVAMIVAEPGSDSQRNAQRNRFEVAYTRTKWRLDGGKTSTTP